MTDVATSLPLVFLGLLMFFIPLANLRSRLAGRVLNLVSEDAGVISCLTLLGGSIFAAPVALMLFSLQVSWMENLASRWALMNGILRWLSLPGSNQPLFHFAMMALFCFVVSCLTDMAIVRWWVQGGRCPDLDGTHPHSVMVLCGKVKQSSTAIWQWIALCNLLSWALIVALVASLSR